MSNTLFLKSTVQSGDGQISRSALSGLLINVIIK